MINRILKLLLLLSCSTQLSGQGLALTFHEAEERGIAYSKLDVEYPSALHSDTALAVFKSDVDQEAMIAEYQTLLQSFGKFLSSQNFYWKKPTNCFNRIYFSTDGHIDYFLFNFNGTPEEKPSAEVQAEFQRLLALFIQNYQAEVSADTKFSQCSPVTFMPK